MGSILAVSNQAGTVIEKRHFEAWGNLTKYWKTGGSTALPNGKTTFLLLDRGYTGHEHLLSVGLVHMNGRLYDPKLHRFLMPDNYVQDPSNTQNYNRYGYVLNNPLKYNDRSGELGFLAIGIAVFVSAVSQVYSAMLGVPHFEWGGFFGNIGMSIFSAVVTAGIGDIALTINNVASKIAFQVIAHGTFNGAMSALFGGNFGQGFLSGSLSSLAASLWGGVKYTDGGGEQQVWRVVPESWGASGIGTVAFGTLAGAGGAALAKGNIWAGAATGFVVSLLNHVAHENGWFEDQEKKPKIKKYNNSFSESKIYYVPVEDVGIGGTFHVKGGVNVEVNGNTTSVSVGVEAKTIASMKGKINWAGSVEIYDGDTKVHEYSLKHDNSKPLVHDSRYTVVGEVNNSFKSIEHLKIRISVNYTIETSGGRGSSSFFHKTYKYN